VRVVRPEGGLPDGQCAPVERFGLRVAALRVIYDRQIAQAHGHVRVIRPQRSLAQGE